MPLHGVASLWREFPPKTGIRGVKMYMKIIVMWECPSCEYMNQIKTDAMIDRHRKGEYNITTGRFTSDGLSAIACKSCGYIIQP